jgi:hypothetical protein
LENKKVEKFFLDYLPKKENIAKSLCCTWLTNYYIEVEGGGFATADFLNQGDRIDAMFPGMPQEAVTMLKLKAYKHRSDQHGDKTNEKRIEELETMVSTTDYAQFTTQVWWMV